MLFFRVAGCDTNRFIFSIDLPALKTINYIGQGAFHGDNRYLRVQTPKGKDYSKNQLIMKSKGHSLLAAYE